MSDATLSKLDSIRKGIRRLTKSPSESQLPTQDIDDAINNIILYKLPQQATLNSLRTVLKFYTQPNLDLYTTNTTDPNDPLYNFKNIYTVSSNTAYVSGSLIYFTQSRSDFYDLYPRQITSKSIGTGDGVTTNFTGTLTDIPILSNNVVFASTAVIALVDTPIKLYDNGSGTLSGDGTGTINYITGVYNITFNNAPKTDEDIYIQSCTYSMSIPDSILFFDNSFMLRPIPDKCYCIEVEVLKRPTELINSTDIPELSEWWEFIQFAAARMILIYRADYDNANLMAQEMENQKEDILYKTVMNISEKDGYGL